MKSARELVASLPKSLPTGAYTIRWRALSSDGHVVSGISTFGVRYPAPPVTEAVGAQGPTTTEHVVRWLYFLALALLVGGIGFRLLVVRGPLPPRAERRFYWVTGIGAVAALEVGIAAFLLRAEDALQLPFTAFLYGDLSSLANGTKFGAAFIAMTLGFALVTALLFLVVADREDGAALARVRCSGSASPRGSRSPGTRPRTPGTRGSRSSPTGCTSARRSCGSAVSSSSSPSSGRLRPSCAGGRSGASRVSPRSASRCSSPPGSTSASCACRACTISGRPDTARC